MKSSKHSSPYSNRLALFRRPTKVARAMALAAMVTAASLPFFSSTATAANTPDIYNSPSSTSLTMGSNWSTGSVPTAANDAEFGPNFPTVSITGSIPATTQAYGSLDDLNPFAITITNGTGTTTASTLTLGGGTGNSVAPAAADLLYVQSGSALTIQNGTTGALGLALAQTGNFDVSGVTTAVTAGGTAVISSVISGGFSLVKTGTGNLTLSAANSFGGAGQSFTLQDGTLSLSAAASLVFGSNSNTINIGSATVAPTVPLTIQGITGTTTLTTYAGIVVNRDFTFAGTSGFSLNTTPITLVGAGTDTTRTITYTDSASSTIANPISVPTSSTVTTLSYNSSGNSASFNGIISNGTAGAALNVTKSGTGQMNLNAADTFTGALTINGGLVDVGGASGAILGTSGIVLNGGELRLDNTSSNVTNRVKDAAPIAINGATLSFYGNTGTTASAASTEALGAVTLGTTVASSLLPATTAGVNPLITLPATQTSITAGNTATLTVASLGRNAGGEIPLMNGIGLGSSASASQKIFATTAPTLVGTTAATATGINAGMTNTVIVPFLTGEATTTTGGVGTLTGTANTFVTYNAATGFRPLNPTDEFATSITGGITTGGSNIYLTTAGANTFTGSTTINSLVENNSGTTSLSVAIPVGQTLSIASGAILFTGSGTGQDFISSVSNTTGTLALGGVEGLITVTGGRSDTINSLITGTAGLTKAGTGALAFTASAGNPGLSGTFTVAAGTVQGSVTNAFGTGPIVDDATVQFNNSGAVTTAQSITGTGTLSQTQTGTTTLSGTGTFTGTLSTTAGRLNIGTGETFTGTISSGGASTLDLGTTTQTVSNLTLGNGAVTTAYTGVITDGSLVVASTGSLTLTSSNGTATTTKLDLSGLTAFTFSSTNPTASFTVGNLIDAVATAPITDLVLAGTNKITAGSIQVGAGGNSSTIPYGFGQIDLGQTNTINADTIGIGQYRANGTIDFRTGLTGATATFRGQVGGTAPVTNFVVDSNANGNLNQGTLDLTGGTVDAIVTNFIVATTNTNGSPTGTVNMGAGTMNVANLQLGVSTNSSTTNAATVVANFNQNAGTVLANTVTFGNRVPASGGIGDQFTSTYTIGTTTGTAATLLATTLTEGTTTRGTGSRALVTFNSGTIGNYNDTGIPGGTATPTITDLTISGQTGGGSGIDSLTLDINLATTAAHNFFASTGHTITETSTALISGTGALTANGTGTLTLNGANTYTGGTNVTAAGTVNATTNTALGAAASTAGLSMTPASGTATVNFTSAAPAIASLASNGGGTSNVVLGNAGTTPAATTLTIGNASNLSSTFAGSISDLTGTKTAAFGNVTKAGTGTLTLSGANTYTGTTLVSAGTLLVNGSTATGGLVTVASGATLGGGGGSVGITTVNGGTVSPGATGNNSMGTLTLASLAMNSATYQVDINSNSPTGGDLLTISGALSGSGSTINIASGTLDGMNTYIIANYASDMTGTVFSNLTFSGNGGENGTYAISESGTTLELVPVPEPSTYIGGLVLVAALGWSVRGRFARRSA